MDTYIIVSSLIIGILFILYHFETKKRCAGRIERQKSLILLDFLCFGGFPDQPPKLRQPNIKKYQPSIPQCFYQRFK